MRWAAVETPDGAHVLPIGDVVEHVESDDCVCGPTSEVVECSAGGTAWLVTHHSLDGREHQE